MKHVILSLCLIGATPALAQEADPGPSLMERGVQMLMEGLMREMEPALEDLQGLAEEFGPSLQGFMQEMGPALRDILSDVQDWSVYEAPEMLDNGDIVIRRKPSEDAPVDPPIDPDTQIEI
ncbi:hypothetical protein [uncultured Tateyamaria sp.]|uniref:hypothetical protein n=1 Tax=uncultured Tateyamaria sp. TaxID=455651 RepID=UPI00261BFE70|nr:hypothetical protein [uncultured Tateyamaria sp.]